MDVRVVCEAHRDLRAMFADDGLREDFYYRIKILQFGLSLLRGPGGNVVALAQPARRHGEEVRAPATYLFPNAVTRLRQLRLPGEGCGSSGTSRSAAHSRLPTRWSVCRSVAHSTDTTGK